MHSQKQPERAEIGALVVSSLCDVLSQKDGAPVDPVGESTYLIGRRSLLDSLGLVTLVVDLEQRLKEEYGLGVTLADDRAMSQRNSPFRTVQSLTDYIVSLIGNGRQHDRA